MIPFGRYELLALLAEGGVAEIWLARQRGPSGFEKLMVVKRLLSQLSKDPEYVDQFLDEARINARLQSSHVLSTYELGDIEGRHFLAMEYLEGLPLGVLAHKIAEALSDVPIFIAGGIVVQAAQGLNYAHEATAGDGTPLSIVHRDVSPLNVLVSFEGVVKVADFGCAKSTGRRSLTRTGTIKGTPTYMSPEQVSGDAVDRRSDIFALGILLWELLTGRRLFQRSSIDETYDAIMSGEIPPPSTYRLELSSAIDAVTLRALARRPDDRYSTAGELAAELEQVLHAEGLRAEVIDLRGFIAEHFAAERAKQEQLLQRARRDDGLAEPTTPLFRRADHGLDLGDYAAEPELLDGAIDPEAQHAEERSADEVGLDTRPDRRKPSADEVGLDTRPDRRKPSADEAGLDTRPDRRKPSPQAQPELPPQGKPRSAALLRSLVVLLALSAAALIGLLLARARP